ncbi:MAG: iron-containing alcohol dehydrogenase, partial [bacterium]|nr:iron-containing alcohol dehydrogenase [bacterium]
APSIQYKKSFRSPHLFPTLAVLDAELTLPLSRQQTAYSGMDAITQLIESFITKNASPLTDALALAGLRLALPAMRRLITDLHDLEAREHLLLASTLSGITLANAGLGMAHGFAPAFGALYGVPHGMACAILLPHAMRFNQPAAEAKFAAIGALVDPAETHPPRLAQAAIAAIQEINDTFQIPRDFQEFQIPQNEKPAILDRSRGNSMNGNPIPVRDDEALAFLEKIL